MGTPHPTAWTPAYLNETGKRLTIGCASCRVLKGIDLLALLVIKPNRPIGTMTFRCQQCGSLGQPLVSWRSKLNQHCSYDFGTGRVTGEWD